MLKEKSRGRDDLCRRDFEYYCKQMDVSPAEVRTSTRRRDMVETRIIIARALRAEGHSLPRIGKAMNKHHTSIVHYLRSDEDRAERNKKLRTK